MTDTSADQLHAPGNGARAPTTPEDPGTRRHRGTSRDETHVTHDEAQHDAPRRAQEVQVPENETQTETETETEAAPATDPVPDRVHVSWRHALLAGVACFAVWLLLDAPTLLHSAQSGPLGTRRNVAIAVLRPLADISDGLGLSHLVGSADRVIGRTGKASTGVLQLEGRPIHPHRGVPAVRPSRGRTTPPVSAPTVTAPNATTPVTAPDGLAPMAAPTASAPLRLLVVGDSLGIDVGQPLVNDLASTNVVSAVLDGHIDTGLARPDYFDWQGELRADLARYQPQAIAVFIGANDPQNFMDGSSPVTYGTPAWNDAYAKRVGAFMQDATASGARVLWIGMPPMADPVLNAKMQDLNGIGEAQAALHRGVTYFASWPVLSDPQGHFATFLPNASGSEVQMREPDGTHIAAAGAQRLSQAAIAFMDHEWGLAL
jgi:hypothetical protein